MLKPGFNLLQQNKQSEIEFIKIGREHENDCCVPKHLPFCTIVCSEYNSGCAVVCMRSFSKRINAKQVLQHPEQVAGR